MKRSYFSLSFAILACLLAGCGSSLGLQPSQKTLEDYRMPTDVPSALSLTETAQAEITATTPPASCPVTVAQEPPFTPPAPYSDLGFEGYFWYGSNSLWTAVPVNGVWSSLPDNPKGYTQKIFWWRDGYVWNEEPQPNLIVTGERLDSAAPQLHVTRATNAYADDIGSAMLTGVDFPTRGCWKITGKYQDAELSFVVWVAP